ncbi:HNH endonuclease [candidate division GN15 bacterium]|jgi:5-methylcytosine-specific restriction endonuclease McrA|nr:HNH endonuclease [candidate division GN15 bacterium]
MKSSSLINRNVLMLNQNYEPLTVCPARRAMILLFQGKAEMIETADGIRVRTVNTSYALPSVVRLQEYKRVPYKRIMLSRKNILMRDDHQCQYCGTRKGPMTIDHVVPRTQHGTDTWENLVTACVKCNNKKGNRSPEKAGMALLRKPARPTYVAFIQRYIGVADQRWRPYLFMD